MRVGEVLLEHGWVDAVSLKRAVAEQRYAGKRLCSLLIARGLLEPDHAARALGEQLGVAAALQRHLEHRDPALAALLPAPLARAALALPIGRMRGGELVVCACDPSPAIRTALAGAIRGPFVLAVAPATQLEALIDLAYEPSASGEFDVDFSTGPVVSVDLELDPTTERLSQPLGEPLGDFTSLSLVGLDDTRVAKDPTQSGMLMPPRASAAITLPPGPAAPVASAAAPPLSLPATCAAISAATSRDEMIDLAMRYAANRWAAALLLTVKDGLALGLRGHGAQLSAAAVAAVVVPLGVPSLVKSAYDTADLATESRPSAMHDRLLRLLGAPASPIAAAVMVGTKVAAVLAIGDPLATETSRSAAELERIVAALGDGFTRIVREGKRT